MMLETFPPGSKARELCAVLHRMGSANDACRSAHGAMPRDVPSLQSILRDLDHVNHQDAKAAGKGRLL